MKAWSNENKIFSNVSIPFDILVLFIFCITYCLYEIRMVGMTLDLGGITKFYAVLMIYYAVSIKNEACIHPTAKNIVSSKFA
jgi:hypothetical protein